MSITLLKRLHAEDLFSGLRSEDEQSKDRKFEVRTNPELEHIIKQFELEDYHVKSPLDYYNYCMKNYNNSFSSKSIENFCRFMDDYNEFLDVGHFLGMYLSVLINKSMDNDFKINITDLKTDIKFIGYENNGKNIIIDGNTEYVGNCMTAGRIILNSDSSYIGMELSGGILEINGNAGFVGWKMSGGTINLASDYINLMSPIIGGNIFHKGKQIIRDGRPVPGAKIKWHLY